MADDDVTLTVPDATPEVKADPFLRIRGGPGRYDLMTWPNPDDPREVEWRLRFATTLGLEIGSGDRMIAARCSATTGTA